MVIKGTPGRVHGRRSVAPPLDSQVGIHRRQRLRRAPGRQDGALLGGAAAPLQLPVPAELRRRRRQPRRGGGRRHAGGGRRRRGGRDGRSVRQRARYTGAGVPWSVEDRHAVLGGPEKLGAQAIQVACHAQKFFSQADQRKEEEQQPSLVQPLWFRIVSVDLSVNPSSTTIQSCHEPSER
ncbi:hypothetical protein PVAP13_1KG203105 [Panicum virgatum]|uniref:Uncharacterized protein n=1 Tax=Panicum virgatum TaxID=38727 RepID=A0A8T0XJW6_PANVG|nr:hypothetical protein PVAP13_1KG203105 [Panicum virgatum]